MRINPTIRYRSLLYECRTAISFYNIFVVFIAEFYIKKWYKFYTSFTKWLFKDFVYKLSAIKYKCMHNVCLFFKLHHHKIKANFKIKMKPIKMTFKGTYCKNITLDLISTQVIFVTFIVIKVSIFGNGRKRNNLVVSANFQCILFLQN